MFELVYLEFCYELLANCDIRGPEKRVDFFIFSLTIPLTAQRVKLLVES